MHVGVVTGDTLGLFIGAAHNGVGPLKKSLDGLMIVENGPTHLTADPLGETTQRPSKASALVQECIRHVDDDLPVGWRFHPPGHIRPRRQDDDIMTVPTRHDVELQAPHGRIPWEAASVERALEFQSVGQISNRR
jgi:hypothetical protein